jgi:D-sedoheptulose 7-phosphate isomerase
MSSVIVAGVDHVAAVQDALARFASDAGRIDDWGRQLAGVLLAGGRLLATGNGGSAAQAQHLTSELVGRYCDDRPAFSAIALHAETSALTAIVNDYSAAALYARQVEAHGRTGDVLVALSTSGSSRNVLAAVDAAHTRGMTTWGMTGRGPNPLAACCDDAVCVDAPATATVQEVHQVVVHLLCAAVDVAVGASSAVTSRKEPVSW